MDSDFLRMARRVKELEENAAAASAALNGKLPKAGGTVTGPIVGNGNAGSDRYFGFSTSGILRWAYGAGNAAESGGNAGSQFFINRFDDNGNWTGTPFWIDRANGKLYAGTAELHHQGNLPYETGSWTPCLYGTTVAGAPVYTYRGGTYTRIGNKVNARGYLILSSKGGMAGELHISGLPFAAAGTGGGTISLAAGVSSGIPTGVHIDGGTSNLALCVTNAILVATQVTDLFAIYSFETEYPI